MPSVVLASADEWEGLYVDGKLVTEGHHVGISDILKAFGIPPIRTVCVDNEWLGELGYLPDSLSEVRESK